MDKILRPIDRGDRARSRILIRVSRATRATTMEEMAKQKARAKEGLSEIRTQHALRRGCLRMSPRELIPFALSPM
jgi:hypothetical protein